MPKRKAANATSSSTSSSLKRAKASSHGSASGAFSTYPASNAYRLLEPGPVVLVTTKHNGKRNIMTMGFHMVMQHDPPLLAVILGPWDHSYAALRATKECVISIPGVRLVQKVVDVGNCSGKEVDKFEKFGLATVEAEKVSAPLVEGCLACLECKVEDMEMVSKYNMWILKVVKAWVDDDRISQEKTFHHRGNGTFVVDGEILDYKERMVLWKEFQD